MLTGVRGAGMVAIRDLAQGGTGNRMDKLSITILGRSYPIWYPFALLLLLLFISAVLSIRSGWRRIAKRFPEKEIPVDRKFRFVRMSLGTGLFPVGYGGAVRVRLGPHGVGLSVIFLLRFLHPPMVIPWSDVASCVRDTFRHDEVTILSVRDEIHVFSFYGGAGESIFQAFVLRRGGETA